MIYNKGWRVDMKRFLFFIVLIFSCATAPTFHRLYEKEGKYQVFTICNNQGICKNYVIFETGKVEELF